MAPRTSAQFEAIRQGRRDEILDAALHVFAEAGYHTSSVSQVAKRAGVSKGLMYNYFSSKEEVLRTLIYMLSPSFSSLKEFHLFYTTYSIVLRRFVFPVTFFCLTKWP